MKYVLISGNPVDGFKFYGPFDSFKTEDYEHNSNANHQLAIDFAEEHNLDGNGDWWIAPISKEAPNGS